MEKQENPSGEISPKRPRRTTTLKYDLQRVDESFEGTDKKYKVSLLFKNNKEYVFKKYETQNMTGLSGDRKIIIHVERASNNGSNILGIPLNNLRENLNVTQKHIIRLVAPKISFWEYLLLLIKWFFSFAWLSSGNAGNSGPVGANGPNSPEGARGEEGEYDDDDVVDVESGETISEDY